MLSDSRKSEIKKLLTDTNFAVNDYQIIDTALTHNSFIFENNLSDCNNYEKLEFLGDAVLKLVVSDILFEKFPNHNEGQLTKIRGIIISDEFLHKLALKIKLNEYLNLGHQEEKTGGRTRPSILACAFEAFLGALYQQGQMEKIHKFLRDLYDKDIDKIDSNMCLYNVKALLQEYTQSKNKELPQYIITNESGKDHEKFYEVTVSYKGEVLGSGSGKSKKEAEKNAALDASIKLGLIIGGKCQI